MRLSVGTYRVGVDKILPLLRSANENGIDWIDTAALYKNDSHILELVANQELNLSNLFVGTKVHLPMAPTTLLPHIQHLVQIRKQALDRVLLHNPLPVHMWRELEECHNQGLVRAIGVSNFDVRHLQLLLHEAQVKPEVIQFELHMHLPDIDAVRALVFFCDQNNIKTEAHSVMAKKQYFHLFENPEEAAKQHLFWVIQNFPTLNRICVGTQNPQHLRQLVQWAQEASSAPPVITTSLPERNLVRHYPIPRHSLFTRSIGHVDTFTHDHQLQRVLQQSLPSTPTQQEIKNIVATLREDVSGREPLSGLQSMITKRQFVERPALVTAIAIEMFGSNQLREELIPMIIEFGEEDFDQTRKMLWKRSEVMSTLSHLRATLASLRKRAEMKRSATAVEKVKVRSEKKQIKMCTLRKPRNDKVSEALMNPTAMPVEVPRWDDLKALPTFLATTPVRPQCSIEFEKGSFLQGGSFDNCKMVVGPAHMGKVCSLLQVAGKRGIFDHFLLGNNIAFDDPSHIVGPGKLEASSETREEGIRELCELMKDECGVKTFYLAGNCIDYSVFSRLVDVMKSNTVAQSLWLKRNPLGGESGALLAKLFSTNRTLTVLDLHNTALGDEGIRGFSEGDFSQSPLHYLSFGANVITTAAAGHLAKLLGGKNFPKLESLFLDINRLGDEGVKVFCEAMKGHKNMKRISFGSNRLTSKGLATVCEWALTLPNLLILDVGYYISTLDLGEELNNYNDVAPLENLLKTHPTLACLKAENCGLSEQNVRALVAAAETRKMTLYLYQPGSYSATVEKHTQDEIRLIKQPAEVDYIFSIYRNSM